MNIICVDDEKPALDNFQLTVKDFPEVDSLHLFQGEVCCFLGESKSCGCGIPGYGNAVNAWAGTGKAYKGSGSEYFNYFCNRI